MKSNKLYLILLYLSLSAACKAHEAIDLSGRWSVKLNGTSSSIELPGTTDEACLGTPNKLAPKLEKPQILHLTRNYSFIGIAEYTRDIDIPREMAHKPLRITLERVLWKSKVSIDHRPIAGEETSLTTPHVHVLPQGLPKGKHTLTLHIDNTCQHDISFNFFAHAYTNETQVMWNGVLGKMTLEAIPTTDITEVKAYPDIHTGNVTAAITIENHGAKRTRQTIGFHINGKPVEKVKVTLEPGTNKLSHTIGIPHPKLWDEFNPHLYKLSLTTGESHREVTFGMREIKADSLLSVNGRKIFLRGTLECCVFPLTGTPPLEKAGWEKVFGTAREWGLNHLRFHSWCPPEAAFAVADSLGFYLQVELPVWSLKIGDDDSVKTFLKEEFDRISACYGNHPSLCLMSVGNELQHDFDWLNRMVAYMKKNDPRRIYTTTSFTFQNEHGRHPDPQDDFFVTQWTDHGWVRGQGVFDTEAPAFDRDYATAMKDIRKPLISHEIGQYCVYPAISEIGKYTGTLNPLNFKAIKADLESKGLIGSADRFTQASGQFAAKLYKEEIERALKTKGFSGFQLLGLQDFPGQGTAIVGLVDAFWDSKGIIPSEEFRQFNAPVVPLARFAKAVYSTQESFQAGIHIANYYRESLKNAPIVWKLCDGNRIIRQGRIETGDIPQGEVTEIGKVDIPLTEVKRACKLKFEVALSGTPWHNSWDIWAFPPIGNLEYGDVIVTADPDTARQALGEGHKVLLSPSPKVINGLESKFLPVFWSPVHFPKQACGMGILCDPTHPALAEFPTDNHSDWQWWRLTKNAVTMNLDSIPQSHTLVSVIDNFANNRRLGYIIEGKSGKGKLVVSSIDLLSPSTGMEGKQLLQSLINYMKGKNFIPKGEITSKDVNRLIGNNVARPHTSATSIYE